MADPRETARAFYAERFHASDCGCGNYAGHTPDVPDYYQSLADAILPGLGVEGVEVGTEYGVLVDRVFTPRPSADEARREVEFCNAADAPGFAVVRTVAARVVIRLPAQPIGEDQPDA